MEVNVHPAPGTERIEIVQPAWAMLAQSKRKRKLHNLIDFVTWMKRWAKSDLASIYWTPTQVVAVLDEQDMITGQGAQDTVDFLFTRPIITKKWLHALGVQFSHKQFKDFLELRHPEITGGTSLFTMIANLSVATTINYDGKLDDDNNYQLAIKVGTENSVTKLPKFVEVEIPLVEGLEKNYRLQLSLLFTALTSADETPTFMLVWDDKDTMLEQAAEDAIGQVREGLPDFLVVQGMPA